jgi:hypothetical protein
VLAFCVAGNSQPLNSQLLNSPLLILTSSHIRSAPPAAQENERNCWKLRANQHSKINRPIPSGCVAF